MAKKQYISPLANVSRLNDLDIITESGFIEGTESTPMTTYGSFDTSWLK